MKTAVVILALAAVVVYLLPACGPMFPEPVFTFQRHPDLPYEAYLDGRLGVLLPTYTMRFLYPAYRVLSGVGFSAEEKQDLLAYYQESGFSQPWEPGLTQWNTARAEFQAVPASRRPDTFAFIPGIYVNYPNCLSDAFQTAAATLRERAAKFGPKSDALKSWITAQDAVFANCDGKAEALPAAAEADAPPLVREDRAYQIAAARFYRGELEEAAAGFGAIGPSSPWSGIAPYLVARCYFRAATLKTAVDRPDLALLAKAAAQVDIVISGQQFAALKPAAARLRDLIRLRQEPGQRLAELGGALARPAADHKVSAYFKDYLLLLGRVDRDAQRRDDLADWMTTFQARDADHALARWREKRTLPWLVAAITLAKDASVPELPQAAEKIEPASPGYVSAKYHLLRLDVARGITREAREELDRLLKKPDAFPPSSLNLLRAMRLKLAASLPDFLAFAPRMPSMVEFGGEGWEPWNQAPEPDPKAPRGPFLDEDSVPVLNRRLPLALLVRTVEEKRLPAGVNAELARAGFVRAALLEDHATADRLVAPVSTLVPAARDYLARYRDAASPEERRFALAWFLLHFPGAQPFVHGGVGRNTPLEGIDNFRDNWWCAPDAKQPPAPSPKFLGEEEVQAGEKELGRLDALGAAPDFLGTIVLAWARAHPDDMRIPEALYLVVRSTRYGCTDAESGKYSREAFDLLHRRYPASEWTRKTPYWFK